MIEIQSTRIDVFFNKHWLTVKDESPAWIVRVNGETHYVHSVSSDGAKVRTVLNPDHQATNAFLRFSGTVTFSETNGILLAIVT